MQRNYEFEEQTRLAALRNLFKMERQLKQESIISKKAGGYYKKLNEGRSWNFDVAYEDTQKNMMAGIRKLIDKLTHEDPLEYRAEYERGAKCLRFMQNSVNGDVGYTYDKESYWVDDFLKAMKGNTPPHHKHSYFRLDGLFYNIADYLEYNGVAYSRKEYAISGAGELIDLSKAIRIACEQNFWNGNNTRITFKIEDWMKSQQDEEFECVDEPDWNKFPIRVSCYEHYESGRGYYNRILPLNYYMTLFKFGKKRYFYRNSSSNMIRFTPEMLCEFEFEPTPEHKRIWSGIREKKIWFSKQNNVSMTKMEGNGENVAFVMEFNRDVVRTSGIKDKIVRNICGDNAGRMMSLGDFLKKMKVLQELYRTEAKYDKSKSDK